MQKITKRVIQQLFMKSRELSIILSELNLELDLKSRSQILQFLNSIEQPISPEVNKKLYFIAGAAIKAESLRIPAVGQQQLVRTGLCLELFFKHIKASEKLSFLKLAKQIAQSNNHYKFLLTKIQEIQRRYCLFLKYREVIQTLAFDLQIQIPEFENFITLLWITYLSAKSVLLKHIRYKKEEQLIILYALVQYLLRKISSKVCRDRIKEVFYAKFQTSIVLSSEKKQRIESEFIKILEKAIRYRRGQSAVLDWQKILIDEIFLIRIIDDMNNQLDQSNSYLSDQINELCFLSLPKLAPKPINKHENPNGIITTTLSYQNSEDDQIEVDQSKVRRQQQQIHQNTSSPIIDQPGVKIVREIKQIFQYEQQDFCESERRRKRFMISQPQSRLNIIRWIQRQIKNIGQQIKKKLINRINQILNFKNYQQINKKIIFNIIQNNSINQNQKINRVNQIFLLFIAILIKLESKTSQQNFQIIFGKVQNVNSFLCLTVIIFNYAYKTGEYQYLEYCRKFGISVVEGFIPLNWLGGQVEIPKQLQKFLFQLQQQILFDLIWKDGIGIDIFSDKHYIYTEIAIKKRTFYHINHQVMRICQGSQITQKDRYFLLKFLEQIINKRINLLLYCNLYSILICSINYFFSKILSINKIQEILRNQKQISINIQCKNQYGQFITLHTYNQTIFLKEVQNLQASHSNRKQQTILPSKQTPKTALKSFATDRSPITIKKYKFGETLQKFEQNSHSKEYLKSLAGCILTGTPRAQVISSSSEDEDNYI